MSIRAENVVQKAMNTRTLKKHLPINWRAARRGKDVQVHAHDGTAFLVDRAAGWEEKDLAQYLASKMPVNIHRP
jgi:hypothetical protein